MNRIDGDHTIETSFAVTEIVLGRVFDTLRDHRVPMEQILLKPNMVVFDSVYNPMETRLLKDAGAAGCATVSGVELFVNQAAEQFELWTGQPAPIDLMRQVVEKKLSPKE